MKLIALILLLLALVGCAAMRRAACPPPTVREVKVSGPLCVVLVVANGAVYSVDLPCTYLVEVPK